MKKTRLLPLIKGKSLPLRCQSTYNSRDNGIRKEGARSPTQAPQRVVNNSTCLPLRPNTELQRINYVYLESLRKFKTKFHFLHNMTPLVSVSHTNVKQGDYRLFYGALVGNYFIVYGHTTYSLSWLLYRFLIVQTFQNILITLNWQQFCLADRMLSKNMLKKLIYVEMKKYIHWRAIIFLIEQPSFFNSFFYEKLWGLSILIFSFWNHFWIQ